MTEFGGKEGNKQYGPVLFLQWTMLFLDLVLNAAAPLLYPYNTVQLVLYILQDIMTIMAVIVLFLTFSSTYVFQAGLIQVLVAKFQAIIYVAMLYLALSVLFHVWSLRLRWEREYEMEWNPGLTAVYVIQRTCAVFYYYFYKRTTLMLGDPRYYQDSRWLRRAIAKN